MKTIPYWIETAGAFPDRSGKPLTEDVDLVVVGAGLTGLSTALHSARKGARVTLVEKGQIGSGASARNGGMANLGFTIGIRQAIRRYGLERAREIYNSYGEAVDTVERLVNEESIDCQFSRVGRLGVASRPAHFESKKAQQRDLAKYFGHETVLIGKSELRSEIGSDAYQTHRLLTPRWEAAERRRLTEWGLPNEEILHVPVRQAGVSCPAHDLGHQVAQHQPAGATRQPLLRILPLLAQSVVQVFAQLTVTATVELDSGTPQPLPMLLGQGLADVPHLRSLHQKVLQLRFE
jgi:hypothetical protein